MPLIHHLFIPLLLVMCLGTSYGGIRVHGARKAGRPTGEVLPGWYQAALVTIAVAVCLIYIVIS